MMMKRKCSSVGHEHVPRGLIIRQQTTARTVALQPQVAVAVVHYRSGGVCECKVTERVRFAPVTHRLLPNLHNLLSGIARFPCNVYVHVYTYTYAQNTVTYFQHVLRDKNTTSTKIPYIFMYIICT